MINLRTDLALDARDSYKFHDGNEPDGVISDCEKYKDAVVTTVKVCNQKGAELLGKPQGTYITIESKSLKSLDPSATGRLSYILKEKLSSLIYKYCNNKNILVVGLGNRNITPDALGPSVVSGIMVTKHLYDYIPDKVDKDLSPVSAISPGVLGITGVETGDIISAVCEKVKPSLVIAVDALASNNPQRISTTIQITDTGINPGSGVGNKRRGLNRETLGVPVVAIGVPTVVDSVSIAAHALEKLCDSILENSRKDTGLYNIISRLKSDDQSLLIKEVLDESDKTLMVTPKEIDNMISHISKVISNGINLSLHKDIDLEYIESFTY